MKEIRIYLDKAQRSLRAAERHLEEGEADFAASHAYYASFYIAEALLATEGVSFSRHGGRKFLAAATRYLEKLSGGEGGEGGQA